MSKISATDFIKQYNPSNISGTVKPSLDMFQSLKGTDGLVSTFQAVGGGNLMSLLTMMQDKKKKEKQPNDPELLNLQNQITQLENLLKNV